MEYKKISVDRISELKNALFVATDDIRNRVIPAQDTNWDYIRGEIWEDSGRIILFPALSFTTNRIDTTGIYIVCREIADKVCQLDESDLSDQHHKQEITKLIGNIAEIIKSFFSTLKEFTFLCFDQTGKEL